MLYSAPFANPISISISLTLTPTIVGHVTLGIRFKRGTFLRPLSSSSLTNQSVIVQDEKKSSVHYDSLRVLEWDKLCDCVASFARTSLGREATKVWTLSLSLSLCKVFILLPWKCVLDLLMVVLQAKLWSLNQSYEESLRLLDETNAAVEMIKHGGCSLDFTGVDVLLVSF